MKPNEQLAREAALEIDRFLIDEKEIALSHGDMQCVTPIILAALNEQAAGVQAERAELESILGKRAHDLIGAAKEAMQDITELRAQLATAQADSKRLDWLEHNGYRRFRDETESEVVHVETTICMKIGRPLPEPRTLRAAIDAAMKETKA